MVESEDQALEVNERFWRRNNPIAYGVGVTVILLGSYIFLGLQQECIGSVCETNFQKFWEADPNEMGDTLAGLFGALAFIWVIVTVLLQSQELREQRREFREQRIATQGMARALAVQTDVLEDERTQRKEVYASEQISTLSQKLKDLVLPLFRAPIVLSIEGEQDVEFRIIDQINRKYSSGSKLQQQDAVVLVHHVAEALDSMIEPVDNKTVTVRSRHYLDLVNCVNEMNLLLAQASPAVRISYNQNVLDFAGQVFGRVKASL